MLMSAIQKVMGSFLNKYFKQSKTQNISYDNIHNLELFRSCKEMHFHRNQDVIFVYYIT